jgi:hypothetical protein
MVRCKNNSRGRKEQRRKAALIRNEVWSKLSTREKIDSLDGRLGKNKGARKQRKKLNG